MFLDLWSIATLTGDFLDLISDHLEFNFTWSLPFVVFVVSLGFLSTFAWRSTDIPDLPPPPQPPYVIQISGTPSPSNNNGERNALADVRLLSSNSTNAESVFRRIPVNINSQGRVNQPAVIATYRHRFNIASNPILHHNSRTTVRVYPQVQTSQQQQPGQNQNDSSVLLGIIPPRSIAIPVQRNPGGGNQPQNVIVYHRVNVYHHHLHHPSQAGDSRSPSEPSTTSSASTFHPTSSTSVSTGSISVDSSTQYEREDTTVTAVTDSSTEEPQSGPRIDSDVNVDAAVPSEVNIETEEDIILDTEDSPLTEQTPVHVEPVGLRQRNSTTASSLQRDNQSETFQTRTALEPAITRVSNSDTPDASSNNDVMDLHQRNPGSNKADGLQGTTPSNSPRGEAEHDIRFTIKFLNDTQMEVNTHTEERIVDFKQRHFATELSENKTVRLIFNGRVLDNDSSTLRESGIFNQCVVHCLIVARPTPGDSPPNASNGSSSQTSPRQMHGIMRAPEPGMFFVAFVGIFLIFLWFICFHFGQHLFTQSAVVSLTVLTAIFLIGLVAFYLPVHPNQ